MIRSRRTIFGAALTGLILVAVCGCSGGDSGGAASTSGTAASTSGGPSAGGDQASLTGAGSTFVDPAMEQWKKDYTAKNSGVTINYQPVGSGAGISQYTEGSVDFGATDAPLSDDDLKKIPVPTIHVPVVAGPAAIVYNLPDFKGTLKLSGDTLAGIFMGKITAWNDPAIAKDNAGATLPSTPIAVCHRSDGSGTTYIFTDYLSTVSPDWQKGPGKGKSVNWPTGSGSKGSAGVAGLVKQQPGGIGYVELAYATKTNMATAQIKNASGNYVAPSADATTAAINDAADKLKADVRSSIVNAPGKDSYPICGFTYILVSKQPKDPAKARALVDFLKWDIADGQKDAATLQYAPLPQSLVDIDNSALDTVQGAK